ncbi:MAG: pilin [bacterium]
MTKLNYKKTLGIVSSFCLITLIPLIVLYAQPTTPLGTGPTIANPLKSDDILVILQNIMNLVAIVGSIVVVFFIIFSGYKIVTSQGNPGELTKAKEMFLATVIGGAILLGADIIANVVINTVKTTAGVATP